MPHKLGTAWVAEDVVSERLDHARACGMYVWTSLGVANPYLVLQVPSGGTCYSLLTAEPGLRRQQQRDCNWWLGALLAHTDRPWPAGGV
jgi:hypothetical protein